MTLRYLSVCSGIEAATVAWHELGWVPVAFSEIESFPCSVLEHHYPAIPNWGDMTKFKEWPDATIDVLVGGTPCQSFSVAGLRKGLADPRGNLMLTYLAIAQRYRPEWVVWENVPGVLSSNGGRDFAAFLRGLAELGYGWAYRVLDAQYFGVPQRRRRVFVVGNARGWAYSAAVLFERESLSGHPAPSRETGERPAGTIKACANGSGTPNGAEGCDRLVPTVSPALKARDYKGPSSDGDGDGQPLIHVAFAHMAGGTQTTLGYDPSSDTTPTLAKCQALAVAVSLRGREGGSTAELGDEVQNCLRASGGGGDKPHVLTGSIGFIPKAPPNSRSMGEMEEQSPTVTTHQLGQGVATAMQVRRLTVRECARLQGFPDTYLVTQYANAEEAHSAQVLHELWRETGAIARKGWRPGIAAALLAPEILLAGVYGGWISWEVASRCADARGSLQGEVGYAEGFLRRLREAWEARRPPYQRKSFGQLAAELGRSVSELPLEEAQAREVLRNSGVWSEAQARWPLRYALATEAQRHSGKLNADGPRYKALGNSMAVPVMAWIGKRIAEVEAIK